jgi:hypothetical protein
MIYFDSDISKSTNTVIYFDWKMVIYIYVCGKCRTQFMLPMEKAVTHGLADISMFKLPTHSNFHDLFLKYTLLNRHTSKISVT